MQTPRERFIRLIQDSGKYNCEELIDWLDGPESDWFTAPASTKHHGAYPGGLVDHSLAVYDELKRIAEAYKDIVQIPGPSLIIVALLHDLCKINTYKQVKKFRKVSTGWEEYVGYERDEQFKFGGHGSKSVYLASRCITLTPEEAAAINCHMSTWEAGKTWEISQVFTENPLAWMLHVADEAATFIMKK